MENKKNIILVNSVTMVRVIGTFLVPVVYIYMTNTALIFYLIILLLTDAADGIMARKLNASTLFGSLLDTIADKLLAIAALAILTNNYFIMILPILAEVLIIVINARGVIKGAITESSYLGKLKTWLLSIAIIIGFITISSVDLLVIASSFNNIYFSNFLNYIIDNNSSIMNMLASLTVGASIIVACDYKNQIKNDINKSKESGNYYKKIKLKPKKDLLYSLFDTNYYKETRNEPLIKKIGVVKNEKIN